ncbi:hypothetical protein HPP92_023342 [Vanilla planifolia]|uniref:Uncharacterized protein n=1 Tax=Vanilla planifolia TaxID=51239 RepID=A0A835UEI0_VANPL|nr:hypothetical protein HPP92_023342 [Vanilla planifolia]
MTPIHVVGPGSPARILFLGFPGYRNRCYGKESPATSLEIGSLTHLRRLNLHGNLLSGPIPSELFNATRSTLSSCTTTISPAQFRKPVRSPSSTEHRPLKKFARRSPPIRSGACRQLQRLLLAGNNLSGLVAPGIWPQLVGLVQLDISSNTFEGPLPPDIGDLDSLSGTLNLSHNHFSGPIPKSLGKPAPAVNLDLRYNNFSGEIPQTGSLTNQGPTAFLNNPGLCGFPLRIQCQDGVNPASPAPPGREVASPETESPPEKRKDMRPGLIVLISMADAAGVAFIGLVAVYIYWKVKDKGREMDAVVQGKAGLAEEERDGEDNVENAGELASNHRQMKMKARIWTRPSHR